MARASSSSRSVSSRASTARRKSAAADSEARSGARTRSTSEAIIVASSRRIESGCSSAPPAFARMCSAPTTVSATRSGMLVTPSPCESSARSSAGERAATASVAPHASLTARLASSARAAARTTSGRPAPDSTASVIASSAA